MAYEYKLPLTYSVNNANNCTSLFAKYTHILSESTNPFSAQLDFSW